MTLLFALKLALLGLSAVLLVVLIVLLVQVIQVVCTVKKMVDRVAFLTDVKAWVSFFRVLPSKKKKSS